MQKKLIVDFYTVRVIEYAIIMLSVSVPSIDTRILNILSDHLPNNGFTLLPVINENPTGNNESTTLVVVNS